jgi:hypothetical protein
VLGVLDSEDVRLDVTLVCHVLSMKPGLFSAEAAEVCCSYFYSER